MSKTSVIELKCIRIGLTGSVRNSKLSLHRPENARTYIPDDYPSKRKPDEQGIPEGVCHVERGVKEIASHVTKNINIRSVNIQHPDLKARCPAL